MCIGKTNCVSHILRDTFCVMKNILLKNFGTMALSQ